MMNTDSKGFLVENLNEFNKEHSPSIPDGFPRELMPAELCKNALAHMMLCLVNNQQNLCGYENKQYYMCKKERDATLFTRIRDWETAQFNALDKLGRESKIGELESQRKEVSRTFEKTPSSIGNKHRRWRMAADIEQLKWRIDYLKEQMVLDEVKRTINNN